MDERRDDFPRLSDVYGGDGFPVHGPRTDLSDAVLDDALARIREHQQNARVTIHDIAVIADDAPRLLAALDAVLNLHRPAIGQPEWCEESGFSWPCSTREAISRALLGEEPAEDAREQAKAQARAAKEIEAAWHDPHWLDGS